MKKLTTSVPNLNVLSQKLANPLLNLALHILIGIPFSIFCFPQRSWVRAPAGEDLFWPSLGHFPSVFISLLCFINSGYFLMLIMGNRMKVGLSWQKYSLIQYKGYNSKFKFFDGVQFRKYFISLPAFYLIILLMKSRKNFEKTSILKI